jgi:inhibitor of KinA
MTLAPLGDSAVSVTLGAGTDESALARTRALAAALAVAPSPGLVDIVPVYAAITVYYEPALWAAGGEAPYARVCRFITERHKAVNAARRRLRRPAARAVEIPVCYGGDFGPDLAEVAAAHGLDADRVIALHAGASYVVLAIGFAPGFAYLGGLPPQIHTPRRTTPRVRVPAGAVGIGGAQTGVYPLETPGGWNLIGATPLRLFDASRAEPALLGAGDRVKFRSITPEEFAAWK